MLLGQDGAVVPIEVKASRDVRPDDLAGLRQFLADVPASEQAVIFTPATWCSPWPCC